MVLLENIQNSAPIMESSRFFVSNLPTGTKEKDLKQLFNDYGEVLKVEIKTKENLVDPEAVKTIAFVTLNIGASDADYCAKELSWQKIRGNKINVSIAKESFLERLKREREEAEAAKNGEAKTTFLESTSELLTQPTQNKKKKFDENDDSLDLEHIAPELLITKKRASSSIYNGKIVIQSYDSTPIHVIENKKATKKLDAKSSEAEQKRKESVKKLKNQYDQKKSAIQKALSGTSLGLSKKIKFSDDEEVDDAKETKKSKTNIFGSDDEDNEDTNFSLKSKLLGKKGEKLVEMQSKQSLDPRFKIDEKFVDDENEEEENDDDEKPNEENDERNWQMGILEQVVGMKVDTGNQQKKANKKKMLRYDPAKDDHRKFERKKVQSDIQDENLETKEGQSSSKAPQVSKEVFYVVKDTLAESLKTRSEGFSLLNMFGNNVELEQREDRLKQVSNEKILINKFDNQALNPFKYDSSSDSEQEDSTQSKTEETQKPSSAKPVQKGKQKVKVVVESFFIPKNDPRLKEGAKFFRFSKNPEVEGNYDEVRNRLKTLIKTKIAKTKKNMIGGGKKKKNNKKFNKR